MGPGSWTCYPAPCRVLRPPLTPHGCAVDAACVQPGTPGLPAPAAGSTALGRGGSVSLRSSPLLSPSNPKCQELLPRSLGFLCSPRGSHLSGPPMLFPTSTNTLMVLLVMGFHSPCRSTPPPDSGRFLRHLAVPARLPFPRSWSISAARPHPAGLCRPPTASPETPPYMPSDPRDLT